MDAQDAIEALQEPRDLYILSLAEPFLTATRSKHRSREGATPAILSADLTHYGELFSKLRFSYVEQVTKERFLRAITSDSPEFVHASENAELEEKLKGDKAALKEKKEEVRELVKELEAQGRHLAARYETVTLQTTQLSHLPESIANLESTIQQLQRSQGPKSDNPALSMPLQPTLDLLNNREDQISNLDRQIEALQAALPHKRAEVAALQDEASILNAKKIKAVEEAKEARRRRENGGMGDEIDERGRWLRGVDAGLKTMLEV